MRSSHQPSGADQQEGVVPCPGETYTSVMPAATALIWSDKFRFHDTGVHPENAERLLYLWQRLSEDGLLENRLVLDPRPATFEDIAAVHDPEYIRLVIEIARSGGGYLDADTRLSERSYEVALLAAGAAMTAVDTVLDGTASPVMVFARPPGHHAERDRGMGVCLFNNAAVGDVRRDGGRDGRAGRYLDAL